MRTLFISLLLLVDTLFFAHALIVNEVMSNPTGDDSGREWIEIYNNSDNDADISGITVSIKGGTFISTSLVSGGNTIPSHGYGIIGSTVSGQTKFMLDYPEYSGVLLKSAVSLVNSGVTSLEIKTQGGSTDTLSSYTAAKEGSTYALIDGVFTTGVPTPGKENQRPSSTQDNGTSTSIQNGNQTTIAQMSAPSADIVLYLPFEKVVIAGAPSLFSTQGITHGGKALDNMLYVWSFGDGGQRTGSTTLYRYFYPGRYIAQVEGTNGFVAGTGRVIVKVVAPDMEISPIGKGKYGSYLNITNPNVYDLDLSEWKISIDGALFSFPKNTLLSEGVTRFSGLTMGFASTTVSSSTLIKILFPNMEEVTRVRQGGDATSSLDTIEVYKKEIPVMIDTKLQARMVPKRITTMKNVVLQKATTTGVVISSTKKDIRLATFIKSLFGR